MDANTIPSAAEVRARLELFSVVGLDPVARDSGVPVTTLIKIRNGQTENPRIETVRALWPHLVRLTATPLDAAGAPG